VTSLDWEAMLATTSSTDFSIPRFRASGLAPALRY